MIRPECRSKYFSSSFTVMPSLPGAPPLAMTLAIAHSRLSGSHMRSINLSLLVGLSVLKSAATGTVPSTGLRFGLSVCSAFRTGVP